MVCHQNGCVMPVDNGYQSSVAVQILNIMIVLAEMCLLESCTVPDGPVETDKDIFKNYLSSLHD